MPTTFQSWIIKNEKIIGTIASTIGIIMFVSLIEVFISNIRGESNIIIQPFATGVNGFFWSLYGYGRKDRFILVPNIIACVLGILTVVSAII